MEGNRLKVGMHRVALMFGIALLFTALSVSVVAAENELEVAKIEAETWRYVVFAVTVTTVKIVAIILGYLIAKLGYTTMMTGVQGENAVELGAFGTTFKFKGVTPGLALGIVGILLMGWALSTKHHFSSKVSKSVTETRTGSAETGMLQEEGNDGKSKPIPPDVTGSSETGKGQEGGNNVKPKPIPPDI